MPEKDDRPEYCRITVKGEMPMSKFYPTLELMDRLKMEGFVFDKHERQDVGGAVKVDYELVLYK